MTHTLYHYYETHIGPFRNLSSLSTEEALTISEQIKREASTFASKRPPDYITIRRDLERKARELFIAKGGRPSSAYPHYMTLDACDWLETWYRNPGRLCISLEQFPDDSISFTYGDLFPTMRYEDGKPYRKQVYTKHEIKDVIAQFGMPQEWNCLGDQGPERYIEVQIWDEQVIEKFKL